MIRFTGDFADEKAIEAFVRAHEELDPKAQIKFSQETADVWFIWVDGDDATGWYLYEDGTFESMR